MIVLFISVFLNSLFAQTYDEYAQAVKQKDDLDVLCKTNFTNEKCNDERSKLRGKIQDLSEVPAIKSRMQTELRLRAWDTAKAYCEKEEIVGKDQAMQVEIAIKKPALEKDRLRLDRKKFCHCRADRRLKAFGKELAGSFYVYNDFPLLGQMDELEKEIFVSCFEQIVAFGMSAPAQSMNSIAFEEKLKKENESKIGVQTVFRFEMNRELEIKGYKLTLIGFVKSEGKVSAQFRSSDGKTYEAVARSDGKNGTFLEGFPLGDYHTQVVRFEPDACVTLRILN